MKIIKKILLILLAGLIVIQFFRPTKNKAEGAQPNYVGNSFAIPENVKTILAKACNDCHTNNTIYPWYSNFQPVLWWLDDHIKDGKKHLNLDEYTNKSLRYQYKKMEETVDMVKKGEMPLDSYIWVHKDAKLTDEEKNKIMDWANSVMDTLKAKYPIDSLMRKK